MKYKIIISVLSAIVFLSTECKNHVVSNHSPKDSTTCCTDSCTVANTYCNGDHELNNGGYEVATADIRIDSFIVTKDGSGHLLLYVHVSGNNCL